LQVQQFAEFSSTENSTCDHLDFRIRLENGAFLNPSDFLPQQFVEYNYHLQSKVIIILFKYLAPDFLQYQKNKRKFLIFKVSE